MRYEDTQRLNGQRNTDQGEGREIHTQSAHYNDSYGLKSRSKVTCSGRDSGPSERSCRVSGQRSSCLSLFPYHTVLAAAHQQHDFALLV